MKTRSAKNKGRRLQALVRNALLERFPSLEPDDIKVAIMGESGEDIKLSPAARRMFPYAIECKNVEKLNMWAALAQATENAKGHTPLLVFGRNRTVPHVALPLDAFLRLTHAQDTVA